MYWLPAIDGPLPMADIIYSVGVTVELIGLLYVSHNYSAQSVDISITQSQTKKTEPNRLVIQIQNCSKGNSKETLATSGTQYGDSKTGVTKTQALGALELVSKKLNEVNKSMVNSKEFQEAKAKLESKIKKSGPQFDARKQNALQESFIYNGTKYRIDLDSYVPAENAPNLME